MSSLLDTSSQTPSIRRHLDLAILVSALTLGLACTTPAPAPVTTPAEPVVVPAAEPVPEPAADPVIEPVDGELAEVLSTAPLDTDIPIDTSIRIRELPNGLRYYVRVNTRPEARAELRLFVNAGSLQEDEDQRGLAHFVEHMAFNGTENYAEHELVDYLQSIGMRFGADLNAYTNYDETVYALRVPTDDPEILEQGLGVLAEWAGRIAFDDEEIEKERGVIVEEWRLGRGATGRVLDEIFPILFQGSRYAERWPIGEREVLETASPDALRRFYDDWYRPDLMAIVAVGDFDPDWVEAKIRELFSGLEGPEDPRERIVYPVPAHEETLFGLVSDPELPSTSATIYYKLPKRPEGTFGDYRRFLVEGLYTQMINARLSEVAQRPAPPFLYAGAGTGTFVRSLDVYTQSAGVEAGGVERGLEALLTEVERVDQHGFTAGELERAKINMRAIYAQMDRERDKVESSALAAEYGRNFLEGESVPGISAELVMVERFLPTITVDEVNELAQGLISEKNRVIIATAPEDEEKALPTEGELLAVFETVDSGELEPWVDQVRDGPLLAELPEPGEVVAESYREALGVTEWRLSNGVRVLLKPTDFKNDQVLISGWSPGGTSVVDDERYTSALFSTTLVQESGLGEFSQPELNKALAGEVAAISPSLGELEEGVSGGAAPQDLETLFQLIYMTFTQPRLEDGAVDSFLTRMRAFLENRRAQPAAVFQDALAEHLYGHHPRRQPMTAESLDRVDPRLALEVYRERFADASDFSFVVVGNFETDSIRPLIERYLGGLPVTGREETWRDIGVRPVEGRVEFEVDKGLEPKSQVSLTFTGPAEWSRENQHLISSLAELLELRFLDVLREDLGATYGVSVSGGLTARPVETYRFSIGFGCAPEKAPELIERVIDEIRKVKMGEIDPLDLQKIRETQRRGRETALKQNGFWVAMLENYDTLGLDLELILDFDTLLEQVEAEKLQEAAVRYLDPERYVLGVLYPESREDEDEAVEASGGR